MSVKETKKSKFPHKVGLALSIICLVLIGLFMWNLIKLGMLDTMLVMAAGGILLVFWLLGFLCQFTRRLHIPGKLLTILLAVILGIGIYVMSQANNMLGEVTNNTEYKTDKMVVIVKKEDPAQNLNDALSYLFGVQKADSGLEGEKAAKAVEKIETDSGAKLNTAPYESMDEVVQALYDGKVQAIVMNEAVRSIVEEHFETFSLDTRVLEETEFKTKIEKKEEPKKFNITKDPFHIYISGIDVYGKISTNSRSDVNIIATINPTTKQVLLTTTPRDYYVTIPKVSNGKGDKLTHAGIYGVDCSMETLEQLYDDIDINYYVRVNFSGVEKIIDAIGGVKVYSKYAFFDGVNTFEKGYNYMDGKKALAFARNRYNVPGGERQRGKNQQAVIEAMIKKITSPSILADYADILKAVSSCIQTNLSDAQLKSLVKMQLKDNAKWNIISLAADGKGGRDYCYSYTGKSLYVMYPDKSTLKYNRKIMDKVFAGEILTEADETKK